LDLLAVSYMLPPNLYPQAIQVGRMLHNLSARIGVVCGQVHQFASGLDCYPDFESRLSYRLEVPFTPRLSGWAHRLAVYGIPLYARAPDEFKSWVPTAEKAVLDHLSRNPEQPQALLTFGEPMSDHLLGLRLKQKLALPWVAHFSDPWSDNPFRRRFPLSNFLNRRYEAQVVRHADRVIFTSQETLDLVMRKYPGEWRAKARVLPHGFEPALYGERQREGDDSIVLRYLGNFYGNRSPLPLFKALAILNQENPSLLEGVSVELVGHIPPRIPPGASAKLISQMGGEVANPRDLPAVVDALRRSIADCRQSPAEKRNTPWGNSTVRQQYCADAVAERLHSIISEVVA